MPACLLACQPASLSAYIHTYIHTPPSPDCKDAINKWQAEDLCNTDSHCQGYFKKKPTDDEFCFLEKIPAISQTKNCTTGEKGRRLYNAVRTYARPSLVEVAQICINRHKRRHITHTHAHRTPESVPSGANKTKTAGSTK